MNFPRSDIAAFIAVVQAGSVSRAADHLGIGQPSVSKAIRRLEDQVGVPLFERGLRGARLTSEGAVFLEAAKRFEVQHVELVRAAADLRARHAGLLRIGITSPAADSPAVRAMAEMVRRRPAMRLRLTIGRSDALNAAIENADLDLAVVPSYPGQALSCAQQSVSEDHTRIAVRAGHPLLEKRTVSLQDLTPFGWVMPSPDSAARRLVFQIFERNDAPTPHVAVEADYTSEAVMGVLMATDLLALVPGSVLRSWLGRVQPLDIPALDIRRSQVLLSHPKAAWTPLMSAFRDLLLQGTATPRR